MLLTINIKFESFKIAIFPNKCTHRHFGLHICNAPRSYFCLPRKFCSVYRYTVGLREEDTGQTGSNCLKKH